MLKKLLPEKFPPSCSSEILFDLIFPSSFLKMTCPSNICLDLNLMSDADEQGDAKIILTHKFNPLLTIVVQV